MIKHVRAASSVVAFLILTGVIPLVFNIKRVGESKSLHEVLLVKANNHSISKTTANNNSESTTIDLVQQQQEIVPQQREESSPCEDQIGPNDVCVTGAAFGGNFNNIITIAHALQDLRKLANSSSAATSSKRGVVRVEPSLLAWYHEWFQQNRSILDVLPTSEECTCRTSHSTEYYFYHRKPDRRYRREARLQHLRHLDATSMSQLSDLLRQDYTQQAKSKLEDYRQMIKGDGSNNSSKYVISVHARWLDGECHKRVNQRINFCLFDNSTNDAPELPPSWRKSCVYRQDYVSEHLPPQYNHQNSIIVLFADGQHHQSEKTFKIRDDSPFQVQVYMMFLSDYHFGNPQSSADKVVATWRSLHNKRSFPEDCYEQDQLPTQVELQ